MNNCFGQYPQSLGRPVFSGGNAPKLPVVAKEYHEFWQTPRYRWWRGLTVFGLTALIWQLMIAVISIIAIGIDRLIIGDGYDPASYGMTLTLFTANNITIGLAIPISVLITYLFIGQKPGWLISIAGKTRWKLFFIAVGIFFVGYVLQFLFEIVIVGYDEYFAEWEFNSRSAAVIVCILLTTPFQAAGEEFLCRGVINRAVASWVPSRNAGLVFGALVSSTVFMILHGAGDIWLNVFYFGFGMLACFLVWRTGGLEASIALHVINNLFSEMSMPFIDFSDMMNREAGTIPDEYALFVVILPLLYEILLVVIIAVIAKLIGTARESAPEQEKWVSFISSFGQNIYTASIYFAHARPAINPNKIPLQSYAYVPGYGIAPEVRNPVTANLGYPGNNIPAAQPYAAPMAQYYTAVPPKSYNAAQTHTSPAMQQPQPDYGDQP